MGLAPDCAMGSVLNLVLVSGCPDEFANILCFISGIVNLNSG